MDDNFNNDNIGNLLNVVSIMLGVENLMENRQQSASNDVQRHNQMQTQKILDDLHAQFEKQNEMLKYQNQILEALLKNNKKGD